MLLSEQQSLRDFQIGVLRSRKDFAPLPNISEKALRAVRSAAAMPLLILNYAQCEFFLHFYYAGEMKKTVENRFPRRGSVAKQYNLLFPS